MPLLLYVYSISPLELLKIAFSPKENLYFRLPLALASKKTDPFSPIFILTERSELSDLLHPKKCIEAITKKMYEIKSLIIDI